MLIAFIIFAIILIYFSWRSFRGGINYLNYFTEQLALKPSHKLAFATVIIPCKGLDHDLEKNLSSFLAQEYDEYETIFVVDDENDPGVAVIRGLIGSHSSSVIAPKAVNTGQKVENLRHAVLHADKRSEVFVFADSDARVSSNWLSNMVAPLANEAIGATTGYRWFITDKGGFAGELRSAWNASIASTLGPNKKSNFCWGGSMAIRREVFERLEIRERWIGTVSDDFTVTRVLREAKMDIHFVPAALAASVEDCTIGELFEFTNRQMKITRVYSRDLWILSFIGSGLFCLVMSAALILAAISPLRSFEFATAVTTLVLVTLFSIGKSWFRLSAVRMAMPDHSKALKRQFLPHIILWALAQPLYLINCISALISNTIIWRGIKYELKSHSSTEVISEQHERSV